MEVLAATRQPDLFVLAEDKRVERLRNWIDLQWAFACIFWPTEAQIEQMARETLTLCETVMEECERAFEARCEPHTEREYFE